MTVTALTAEEVARQRFAGVRLDERICLPATRDARILALAALLESSRLIVRSAPEAGPYHLLLSLGEGGLALRFSDLGGNVLDETHLPFQTDWQPILAELVVLDDETTQNLGQLFSVLQDFA